MCTRLVAFAALAVIGGVAAGCQQTPSPPPTTTTSLPATPAPPATPETTEHDDDHGHEHEAPHGGTLVEFGDEHAHLELVFDPAAGVLTAYALDGEAESPVRLTQPSVDLELTLPSRTPPVVVSLSAAGNALTGEKIGDTSQFTGSHPALRGVTRFAGRVIEIHIRGERFADVTFEVPGSH